MTRNHLFILSAAAIVLSACASDPRRGPPPNGAERSGAKPYQGMAAKPIALLLTSMDDNRDHILQANELVTGIDREWGMLAADGDSGALNYSRWAKTSLGSEDALPTFISFDRDLNGRLTRDEFNLALRSAFDDFDTNSDSALQRSELIFRVAPPARQQGGQQSRGESGGNRQRPPRR